METVSTGSYDAFPKNRYWILRHGKSIPNQRALIVSSLENGILEEYELASDGVQQALSAGHSFGTLAKRAQKLTRLAKTRTFQISLH